MTGKKDKEKIRNSKRVWRTSPSGIEYGTSLLEQNENDLPFGWQRVKLGDIAKKKSIKVLPSEHEDIRFIGMDCIEPHTLKPKFTYKFGEFKSSGNYFEKGQILYGRMRPYLNKVYKAEYSGACSGEFIVLQCTENFAPDLLQYILHSRDFVRFANNKTAGDRPRISYEEIADYPIALTSIEVQHRIVSKIEELFSELDKGVEQLKTAQQQLKVYRQAVLEFAFEGKLTNKVESEELPTGWKWCTIGDVCSNVEYGSAAKSNESGKIPVLRMGNIQNGIFDWDDLVYTDDEDEIKKYILKKGDVLFNRTNSAELVGKTAIYKGERPAIFAGYLIRINRMESLIDASYLTYFLNSHFAKSYGNSVRTFGVNQSNINGTKLKTYPIPLPSVKEQQLVVQEIERRLSVCENLEETIVQNLDQAEALRQSILKKAFEGKLISENEVENVRSLTYSIPEEQILKIAAEPKTQYKKKTKPVQIQFPKVIEGIKTTDLHAGILAMVIDAHEKSTKHSMKLSHVKGEKIAHLVEAYVGIDLGRVPKKDAAGPDDFPHLRKVESRAAKAGWFGVKKLRVGQTYVSKSGMPKIIKKVKETLPGEYLNKIEQLIQTFLPFELEHAEVIATLYAGWNNLLLEGKNPTDEEIIYESRENWSKRKLTIERDLFFKSLKWMHDHRYIPIGIGKKVE